jgi:dCTP deaminase
MMRFVNPNFAVLDPKNVDVELFKPVNVQSDKTGEYYMMPAYSSALGVTVERFAIPHDVTGIAMAKSTYARVGLVCTITPLEPGWQGYLTMELANHTPYPVKVYANEGIAQILFHRGDECNTTYADRGGKYQNQASEVTHSRV